MATSPDPAGPGDDEVRPEYDFRAMRGVVRGKYAARYRERLRVVRLAEDVAGAFAGEGAGNRAPPGELSGGPAPGSPAQQGAAAGPRPQRGGRLNPSPRPPP